VSVSGPAGERHRYGARPGRTVDTSVTLARLMPVLDRIGVTRLADVTALDHVGIPVVQAVRPGSRSLSVSQGKGATLDAARVSAAMEALEFHHAENYSAPLTLASHSELRARGAPLCEVGSLARREGSRFNDHIRIPWVLGTGLATGTERLVPFEMVDMDLVEPRPYLTGCFYGGTNGLASGNCREEAVLHGLCEVVERDANALWWNRPRSLPDVTRIEPDSITDPALRDLIGRFGAVGISLYLWSMTSDLGIAAFSATAIDGSMGLFRRVPVIGGHGCHPNRAIALRRAVTEVAQARVTAICASRDDITRASLEKGTDGAAVTELRRHLDTEARPGDYGEVPDHRGTWVEEDIDLVLARILGAGLPEPVAVDLTDPTIGIPVVKVIAPGLESNPAERTRPGSRLSAVLEYR